MPLQIPASAGMTQFRILVVFRCSCNYTYRNSMFKEKIKDIGRQLTGEGPEVKFKSTVDQYERSHGVSHEAAEKAVFMDRFNAVQHELTYTRSINKETYRALVAGMNEVFGKDGVFDMKRDAADPAIYRVLTLAPASLAEFNQTASYFKTKFENKVPNAAVIKDCAENKKIIEALHTRFSGDPLLAGTSDLEALMGAHPELGADLGKILLTKELSDMHEQKFENGLRFKSSIETLGNTAKESLGTMIWKAPNEWWKTVNKSKQTGFGFAAESVGATAKLLYKEGRAGTKLLMEMAKTAKAYIDTKRA